MNRQPQQDWVASQNAARGNGGQYGLFQGQSLPQRQDQQNQAQPMQGQLGQLQAQPMQAQYEHNQTLRILELETQLDQATKKFETELDQTRKRWLEQARQDSQTMGEQKAMIRLFKEAKQELETKCARLENQDDGQILDNTSRIVEQNNQLVNQNEMIMKAVQRLDSSPAEVEQPAQRSDQVVSIWRKFHLQLKAALRDLYMKQVEAITKCRSEVLDEDIRPELRLPPTLPDGHWGTLLTDLKDA
ncbi:hypothetical protein CKM354_001197500 [Cercospora kikuchii]|uniref:Uncharacterized protein n=1 Tax=Cercospora kikuchii TaxID=84275 RepID=A0A9P3FKL8_9PEZI|nr:uncharacterized protein CKM354_001197500 [Cercospora kikuchii]GIZ48932.1 hypothetical protein CKM354_001197500 [Cercospora kikuchii]